MLIGDKLTRGLSNLDNLIKQLISNNLSSLARDVFPDGTLSILGVRISAVTRQLSYEVMPGPDIFQMCSMPGECPSQYVRVAGKFTL